VDRKRIARSLLRIAGELTTAKRRVGELLWQKVASEYGRKMAHRFHTQLLKQAANYSDDERLNPDGNLWVNDFIPLMMNGCIFELKKMNRRNYKARARMATDSLVDLVLDQRKLAKLRNQMDEQTYDLMVEVYSKLAKDLELTRGQQEAINRLSMSMGGRYSPDMHRNNIFKAAHALGMKLPSGIF